MNLGDRNPEGLLRKMFPGGLLCRQRVTGVTQGCGSAGLCPSHRPSTCLSQSWPGACIMPRPLVEPQGTTGWVPAGKHGLRGSRVWEASMRHKAGYTRCRAPFLRGDRLVAQCRHVTGCRHVPADGWVLWRGQHCLSPPHAPTLVRGDPGMPKVKGVGDHREPK